MIDTIGVYYHAMNVVMMMNWPSMFQTFGMYNHALSVVIRQRQQTEHVPFMNDI